MSDKPQPKPKGNGKIILDLVLDDLDKRAEMGLQKYGTYLRANNGRDALMDAYQEACDLVMYLRQAIYERDTNSMSSSLLQARRKAVTNDSRERPIE